KVAQTLAAIGQGSTLGVLKSVVAKSDDDLNRMLGDLELREIIYQESVAGDLEYAFKHMLTQDAAYTSISIEQRSLLHERIGSALETLFAESANDHLSELAHHYSRSSNGEKAVHYLESAGRQAVNRGALREAEIHFRHAIGALRTIPETSERIRREF